MSLFQKLKNKQNNKSNAKDVKNVSKVKEKPDLFDCLAHKAGERAFEAASRIFENNSADEKALISQAIEHGDGKASCLLAFPIIRLAKEVTSEEEKWLASDELEFKIAEDKIPKQNTEDEWESRKKLVFKLLSNAQKSRYAPVCTGLGFCYEHGWGVDINLEVSSVYYMFAATHGDSDGQYCYARNCLLGRGTEQDRDKAIFWFRIAVLSGNENAKKALQKIKESIEFKDISSQTKRVPWKDEDGTIRCSMDTCPPGICESGRCPIDVLTMGVEIMRENPQSALIFFNAAAKMSPDFADAWCKQGYVYGAFLNNDKEAKKYFQKALEVDPDNLSAMERLAIAEAHLHNWDTAFQICDTLITKYHDENAHQIINVVSRCKENA